MEVVIIEMNTTLYSLILLLNPLTTLALPYVKLAGLASARNYKTMNK